MSGCILLIKLQMDNKWYVTYFWWWKWEYTLKEFPEIKKWNTYELVRIESWVWTLSVILKLRDNFHFAVDIWEINQPTQWVYQNDTKNELRE